MIAMSRCKRRHQRSRSCFYTQQLIEVAGHHRATWRLAKELLHSDDHPPSTSPRDAAKLFDGFCHFFKDKLEKIADTVASRLSNAAGYHRQASKRQEPRLLDELAPVTVDEVVKLLTTSCQSACLSPMSTTWHHSSPDWLTISSLKQGRVTPLLKKPGLDQSDMASYRTITNLSTMSKILEKLALRRLRPHVMSTGNFSEFQSGHSTETALLKIVNDVVTSTCDCL